MRRIYFLPLILILAGCDFLGFKEWHWHQKLTVSVQTPDGPKTASSISAASWSMSPEWFRIGDSGGGSGVGKLEGEAVVLDLHDGKYLFALLKGYTAETAIKVFAEPPLETDHRREYVPALDRISTIKEARQLRRDQYPLLATFGDVAKPESVKRVDPDNLEASFGAGYRLNSISMTITDDPVTAGTVEAVLGWLKSYYSKRFDGHRFGTNKTSNPFANSLASGAFDTEKE